MKLTSAALAGVLTLMSAGAALAIVAPPPPFIAAAVADAGRPAADRERDAARLPGDVLAFAELKQGQKVAEMLPGGGYFTRVFSKAVGAGGKVYAVVTPPQQGRPAFALPGYDNVAVTQVASFAALKLPEQVDLAFTAQNYHDLAGNPANDMVAINRAVFDALKPGGLYVVIDHEARAGDTNAPRAFHRIDPARVVQEVTAAGFMSVGESDALERPADPLNVASSRMHDQTSQFVYKFRKPLR